MAITLRPKHEKLVAKAMQTGAYENPEEVISRALEMLHSEDEWLREHKEQIAEKIERGIAQFERGEYFSAEESRTRMRKHKAEWIAKHKR